MRTVDLTADARGAIDRLLEALPGAGALRQAEMVLGLRKAALAIGRLADRASRPTANGAAARK